MLGDYVSYDEFQMHISIDDSAGCQRNFEDFNFERFTKGLVFDFEPSLHEANKI